MRSSDYNARTSASNKNVQFEMHHNLYRYEGLLSARSVEALDAEFQQLTHALGYRSLFYAPLLPRREREAAAFQSGDERISAEGMPSRHIFTTFPGAWIERYQVAGYAEVDPVLVAANLSPLPILWRSFLTQKRPHPIFADAREHGLGCGVSIPLYGAAGERAIFTAATPQSPDECAEHEARMVGEIYLSALYFHQAVQQLDMQWVASRSAGKLSPREIESLLWAARGKTAWEIGLILKISEHTVTFHINNAKRKLGAVNRHQAIAAAISSGLIAP
ncbi:Transcriptional activator protein LasR [Pandoraea pneumonica]|jgi:DNA-binding CsgD family transcriptional regulator|uniref:Transcriptional activator protein LasR n=2 Tax=Pandoraea pneumonica TaxID=2508299 RepID=A0A5E4WF52_9BURK|nr:Transcriptional activator protein LasR [Pandoraea pneumonica]